MFVVLHTRDAQIKSHPWTVRAFDIPRRYANSPKHTLANETAGDPSGPVAILELLWGDLDVIVAKGACRQMFPGRQGQSGRARRESPKPIPISERQAVCAFPRLRLAVEPHCYPDSYLSVCPASPQGCIDDRGGHGGHEYGALGGNNGNACQWTTWWMRFVPYGLYDSLARV